MSPSTEALDGEPPRLNRFLTLEGGEGTGKSTQIARMRDRLVALGYEVVSTREPGGSPRAEAIRRLLLGGAAEPFGDFAEAVLFAAARADHVERTIRPALARGAVVLCDRFVHSTRVYQGRVGQVPAPFLSALERSAVRGLSPALTIVLDLPAAIGLKRARARRAAQGISADRFEAEGLGFHDRIRSAFLEVARAEPRSCVVVDADAPADAVEERVWQLLEAGLLAGAADGGR